MLEKALTKIFGSKHDREMKKLQPIVDKINSFEPTMKDLRDADLQAKTGEFKQRLENGETLDDILFEAFECDIVYIDFVVRGFTRLDCGRKIYNDNYFNSIQLINTYQ